MKDQEKRIPSFQRNSSLEYLLPIINDALIDAEKKLSMSFSEIDPHPLIFIVGPLRSGTTLFMQWLGSTGIAAYPTNLLSRFYAAPVTGALIQLLLTEKKYNFRDELLDIGSLTDFSSENGKTIGALSPNEFWYFWRRFLPFGEIDWLPDHELLQKVNYKQLEYELNSLTRVFEKPFAMKAMILNYNIPFLRSVAKNAIFIQMKRNPVSNIASIIEARKRQSGDENIWYSFKIPEYEKLKNLTAIEQATGQFYYISKAVDHGMKVISDQKKVIIQYEDFCKNPAKYFLEICERLGVNNIYTGIESFQETRHVENSLRIYIEKSLADFSD